MWQSGVLLVDTLSTPSLAPYYLYSYSVSGTIIGNVIIESQYAGLGLYNNTWNITGIEFINFIIVLFLTPNLRKSCFNWRISQFDREHNLIYYTPRCGIIYFIIF